MDEYTKYMKRLVQLGVATLFVALCFDVSAAFYSHIALWQVLMWFGLTCVVISTLFFLAYFWLERNST